MFQVPVPRRRSSQSSLKVEQRYEFIEFRLFWQGQINRSDLMDAFGISTQQASLDLKAYGESAPENLAYDARLRTYRPAANFAPRYFHPDAAGYLSQLQAVNLGLVTAEEVWISDFPAYGATPTPARGVAPEILRAVLAAARKRRALQVTYQSMSQAEPTRRWIEPHALAFDGFRWHARAFCRKDQCFKDFLLSRILAVGETEPGSRSPEEDVAWHREILLEIAPHPGLSDAQRRAIELDYGMTDGKAEITVRQALLFYALKRLGLDTDPAACRPQDQQIVLLNRDSVLGSLAQETGELRRGA